MIEFPKWKYKGAESKLVNSAEEEVALGEGWGNAPVEPSTEPVIDPRDAEIAALKAALAESQAPAKSKKSAE